MINNLPNSYTWFSKLNLNRFIPWHFNSISNQYDFANEAFRKETIDDMKIFTFGHRQDMDTFAGFEIIENSITERVIVFHPSFQQNIKDWSIIESEHEDFFDFIEMVVLPDMKAWIVDDDVEDYI